LLKHVSRTDDWSDKNIAQKGFTLVELLVVIIILGILAAVVIFAVQSTRENSKEKACQTEEETIRAAIAGFVAAEENNNMPTTQAQIQEFLEMETSYYQLTSGEIVRIDSECPVIPADEQP
jgi:prepilin-type N-terminal cleavage/methylation domain-containing protein